MSSTPIPIQRPGGGAMSMKEAAKYLGISTALLSRMVNGKVADVPPLRHVKIGRRILFKLEWLEEWLREASR